MPGPLTSATFDPATYTGAYTGTTITATTKIVAPGGATGYTFASDETTKLYLTGANDLRLNVGGELLAQFTNAFIAMQKVVYFQAGTVGAVSIGSYDNGGTGVYFTSSGATFNISANGVRKASFGANGTNLVLPTSSAGLSAGDLWNNLGIVTIV